MTRTVVLMRHAKSSWTQNLADMRRDLSDRGRRDAAVAGTILADRGLAPDVVLLSPARRAQATWEQMADSVTAAQVQTQPLLYEGDSVQIASLVSKLPEEATTVVVIGHAPTVPDAVSLVATPEPTKLWYRMDTKFPTAAMAIIAIEGPWGSSGRVEDFVIPRANA